MPKRKQKENIMTGFFFLTLGYDTKNTSKSRNSQWECIKLKKFWVSRDALNAVKKQPLKWKEIPANLVADKWCVSRIYYMKNS